MKVYTGFDALPRSRRGAAVAIGNFDGLHVGHRRILSRVAALAGRERLRSLVLTFFPHPARALAGRDIPLVQTLDQRLDGFRRAGVEGVLVVPLDRALFGLSGPAFAEGILAQALRARAVVIGANFRFGRGRACGAADLADLGHELGFAVHTVPSAVRDGRSVSSSLIRRLLAKGDVSGAAELLGTPYEIEGRVVPGHARGRALGFPTANLLTANEILPPGVFLTVASVGRRAFPALTNIGVTPTFGNNPPGVETHFLGFRGDLYGRIVRLGFIRKLRNERRFATPEALVRQVARDLRSARAAFLDISGRMVHVLDSRGKRPGA
ncbi:MAG TPA: riboflavin biosynthesis protein RibF [Acidobacteriota bacterium]|nr:riboflavin biosynthesis protein RibF [Acidobacteriota bacterium]